MSLNRGANLLSFCVCKGPQRALGGPVIVFDDTKNLIYIPIEGTLYTGCQSGTGIGIGIGQRTLRSFLSVVARHRRPVCSDRAVPVATMICLAPRTPTLNLDLKTTLPTGKNGELLCVIRTPWIAQER